MKKHILLAAAAALLVAGCTPPPMSEVRAQLEDWLSRFSKGEAHVLFASGLRQYEAGEYADAAESLHAALTFGLPMRERVSAHKHLAFIYCSAELEPACASEFRKALIADPGMDLDDAEAGHPAWGPLFRHVKAER
jgi:Tfp pilus assembly protein PilF